MDRRALFENFTAAFQTVTLGITSLISFYLTQFLSISDVFRGCRNVALGTDGLNPELIVQKLHWNICSEKFCKTNK